MENPLLVPAAQYLRMSTDRQEYSLANQRAAIEEYAALHSFRVVRTYADPGKSGLVLKHRPGLMQLLSDVTATVHPFEAVLVYDVSRWGRFQDNDEAAHYEFICKRSGAPVHYCAEPFANDCTVPSLIMKALKRTMAGEFSRELGARVYQAQRRMVLRGFSPGGKAGYGLRRKMVSIDGRRDRILQSGEYKGVHSDHIKRVRGPEKEIRIIQQIYELYLRSNGRLGPKRMATELNRQHIPFFAGKPWDYHAIHQILSNPKYTGANVWGRTTQRLGTTQRRLPREDWIEQPCAFAPIIDSGTFERVQRIRAKRKQGPTNDELLRSLTRLLLRKGRLTRRGIDQAKELPSLTLLRKRFGNMKRIFDLVGSPYDNEVFVKRQRGMQSEQLRDEVAKNILETFPDRVSGFRTASRRHRPILLVDDDFTVSVVVARPYETPFGKKGWCIHPVPYEYGHLTLLCRLNESRDSVAGLSLMPPLRMRVTQYKFDENDSWFRSGKNISVSEFYQAVLSLHATTVAGEGCIERDTLVPLRRSYGQRVGSISAV